MTIQASVILDSVSTTLLDTARRTWGFDELLGYLNEALRTTAFAKPDTYVVQDFVTLDAGLFQTLPDGGIALINITRNAGGRVVTQVEADLLEEANRFWPAATQQTQVEHYTSDPRNPRRYQVFPPNNGSGNIEVIYGAVPPEITMNTGEIPVPDSYQNALTNFTLSKCYAKNSKKQDLSKASYYMQQWGAMLGLKSQAQIAVAPHVSQSPDV